MLLGGSTVRVVSSRKDKAHLVVRLDAVGDRTTAESLRGSHLAVPLDEVEPPAAGSYYHYQIMDMDVSAEDGSPLGKVVQILPTGSNDVYVVVSDTGNEILLPAVSQVIREVDLASKRVLVHLIDGLR
jgi:16S rRNA processing protein RimM